MSCLYTFGHIKTIIQFKMRTIRIDQPFVTADKLNKYLKKNADKNYIEYCFCEEIGTHSGKLHCQGWYTPLNGSIDATIYKWLTRTLSGAKEKVDYDIDLAKDPKHHIGYILNNTNKPKPSYNSVFTSLSESQFSEYQEQFQFVEHRPYKLGKKTKQNDWWWNCLEALEEQCVIDGKIIYGPIPDVFEDQPWPKKCGKVTLAENLNGMISHLETKYEGRRYREEVTKYIREERSGLFGWTTEEINLFKKHKQHKNGDSCYTKDCSSYVSGTLSTQGSPSISECCHEESETEEVS